MVWNVKPVCSAMPRQSARSSQATRRTGPQLETEVERPVEPKPLRGTLGVLGRVVGAVPGRVTGVVTGRVVVGVAVRVTAGRDKWLLLLVRVQPLPVLPHDRR